MHHSVVKHSHTGSLLIYFTINICFLLIVLLEVQHCNAFLFGNLETPPNYLSYKYPSTTKSKSLPCSCGIKNKPLLSDDTGNGGGGEQPPVVATQEISFNEYPWQVLMFRRPDGKLPGVNEKVFDPCGGSIINDRMILTSASCIWDLHFDPYNSENVKNLIFSSKRLFTIPRSELKVVLINEKKKVQELEVEEVSYVKQFAIDKFAGRYKDWDIGLIKLKIPLNFSDNTYNGLRPVCLPPVDSLTSLPGQVGAVLLWSYAEGGHSDGIFNLPELSLNSTFIHEFSECQVNTWNQHLSTNFLCMETKRSPDETPHRGYPVTVHNAGSNIMFQVGVTSWTSGYGGMRNMLPSLVFSNISNYIGFIEKTANDWDAQWCSQEPTFDLPPVHSSFDPKLLTARSQDVRHPWTKFPTGSRTEGANCQCGYEHDVSVIILINRISKVVKCEGTLVNNLAIVSPAHCYFDENTQEQDEPKNIEVYFHCDATFHNTKDSCNESLGIHKIIVHPTYTYRDPRDDIALLILEKGIIFQSQPHLSPLCLPKLSTKVEVTGRTDAIVTRWINKRWISDSLSSTLIMNALQTDILDKAECMKITSKVHSILKDYHIRNLDENLCIRVNKSTYGNYKSFENNGGPLFLTRTPSSGGIGTDSKPQYFLVGIFQWGDMRNILYQHIKNNGPVSEINDDTEIVEAYTHIQDHLSFIEYYSSFHGAKWCSGF